MLLPFPPSQDFEHSRLFYEALGFATQHVDCAIAIMEHGSDSFILQNFYVNEWAQNTMTQLMVTNLDGR